MGEKIFMQRSITSPQTTSRSQLSHLFNNPQPAPVWILPIVGPSDHISAEFERKMNAAARAAQNGDQCARDTLYQALAPKLNRYARRYRYGYWGKVAGRAWEQSDVQQETYLVFVQLLMSWSSHGSFPRYVLGHFVWRLATAMRRLHGVQPPTECDIDRYQLLHDDSADAAESLVLLETIAENLHPIDRALLLGHIRDEESFSALACRLGISRRSVHRRWLRLITELRASFDVASVPPPVS